MRTNFSLRTAWRGSALALLLCGALGTAQAFETGNFVEPCARNDSFPRPAVNGPFDYRKGGGTLRMVESNHFAPQIENLVRGRTGTLAQELSFVLHGYPNHHRALVSISRYALRERNPAPGNLDYTVDCYYARAMRFQPDDHIVKMLYADYLTKTKRSKEALQYLDAVAASPAGESLVTAYNLGLQYLDLGQTDQALAQAHKAMALGNARTGLADALRAKGKWVDPAPAAAAPASDAASRPAAAASGG